MFCIDEIHYPYRIHVWYIYIYANMWGILMVNVTIYMDPMGYESCSMNMKIYHDKLVDHQFIWCEYCNNARELLNERGFISDLYIEHH